MLAREVTGGSMLTSPSPHLIYAEDACPDVCAERRELYLPATPHGSGRIPDALRRACAGIRSVPMKISAVSRQRSCRSCRRAP